MFRKTQGGSDRAASGQQPAAPASSNGNSARRAARRLTTQARAWNLSAGDPEAVVAEARRALFVMVGVLAVLWLAQIANWADGGRLTFNYGIQPRNVGSLPYIITAPFLHFSWAHLEGNSGPLFIFGFLAAYRGVRKFLGVTIVVVLTSGFGAWLFESTHTIGAGASGVVFGYFGYIMVRGLFDRHAIDLLIGAVMALCFAYQFTVLLPQQGIGWQAHIGGLVGGVLAGWVFRDRRPAVPGAKAVEPAARTVQRAKDGTRPGTAASQPGKSVTVAPDNPRAELHKQLDDMGL
ncbi:MAG TPA: rhomboid family intramembrane serine protease [Streptosporangiaceae bacterium]|jgi:membrane associated rhomboid family serine protease